MESHSACDFAVGRFLPIDQIIPVTEGEDRIWLLRLKGCGYTKVWVAANPKDPEVFDISVDAPAIKPQS